MGVGLPLEESVGKAGRRGDAECVAQAPAVVGEGAAQGERVGDGVAGVEGDVVREVLEVGLGQGLRARVGPQCGEQ